MKLEDKRCDARLGMYQFLVDGNWVDVNPYDYHAWENGDTVPYHMLERSEHD
ncbi:hypothetical protein [Streptococcus danieliae]|uniref:Uncharacterized protein n=1 Tax=Streptococcus danieliae TaxID=747656 RepID=A0A7Z0M895_9STRE|nr:hypothetical protein [Streptococcus danieliae]MBF0700129.1 hypothetical protein [Streptococcus danieliae]MBF0844104.1 hypothetical protein [Streptococcus danieliae]NYS97305.1 hypothetical protein [Streptococcus danieliae]